MTDFLLFADVLSNRTHKRCTQLYLLGYQSLYRSCDATFPGANPSKATITQTPGDRPRHWLAPGIHTRTSVATCSTFTSHANPPKQLVSDDGATRHPGDAAYSPHKLRLTIRRQTVAVYVQLGRLTDRQGAS
jgi:hypothetical protein